MVFELIITGLRLLPVIDIFADCDEITGREFVLVDTGVLLYIFDITKGGNCRDLSCILDPKSADDVFILDKENESPVVSDLDDKGFCMIKKSNNLRLND